MVTKMTDAQGVIEARAKTHGDFPVQAGISQALKGSLRHSPSWDRLSPGQKECCEMIAMKLSRIVSGSPNEPDHWTDIAGYATLISNGLTKGTHLG